MDGAGSGLELDVVGERDHRVAVEERVPHREAFERGAFDLGAQRAGAAREALENRRCERFRDDHVFVPDAVHAVCRIGLQRDRDVGRQRPGRRRPDDDRERHAVVVEPEFREQRPALRVVRAKADVDRRRRVVLVLDLRFGERGLVVDAPQRRAQAFVEVVALRKVRQRLDDRRLELRRDRHVRIVVPAEAHAHAQHLLALVVQPVERALAAGAPQLERIRRAKIQLEVLERLALDRQAVHVPAGHEVGVAAIEQVDLDQRVLEHAVEKMPHVQVAVRIRGPVVQHEGRAAVRAVLLQPLEIRAVLGPPPDAIRFALWKLAPHRKLGLGEVEGRAIIARSGVGHRNALTSGGPVAPSPRLGDLRPCRPPCGRDRIVHQHPHR